MTVNSPKLVVTCAAMLAALEGRLSSEGVTELELNVCETNLSAKRLYANAGFMPAAQFPTMRQLRKRLNRSYVPTAAANRSLASSTSI